MEHKIDNKINSHANKQITVTFLLLFGHLNCKKILYALLIIIITLIYNHYLLDRKTRGSALLSTKRIPLFPWHLNSAYANVKPDFLGMSSPRIQVLKNLITYRSPISFTKFCRILRKTELYRYTMNDMQLKLYCW